LNNVRKDGKLDGKSILYNKDGTVRKVKEWKM
jgi:hypothetical protein